MQSHIILALVFISLFATIFCDQEVVTRSDKTIFYFAYGSNLLAKRMHLNNPTAVFYSTAKLKNHRLDFNLFVEAWQGNAATIVEDDEEEVWGAVWTLDVDKVQFLDQQEGVDSGWYFAKNVTVTTPTGQQILARTYEETQNPNKTTNNEDLPVERRPSNTYLEVIILGAIESHLPAEYIGFLTSFPTNRKMAKKERREELGYPF